MSQDAVNLDWVGVIFGPRGYCKESFQKEAVSWSVWSKHCEILFGVKLADVSNLALVPIQSRSLGIPGDNRLSALT